MLERISLDWNLKSREFKLKEKTFCMLRLTHHGISIPQGRCFFIFCWWFPFRPCICLLMMILDVFFPARVLWCLHVLADGGAASGVGLNSFPAKGSINSESTPHSWPLVTWHSPGLIQTHLPQQSPPPWALETSTVCICVCPCMSMYVICVCMCEREILRKFSSGKRSQAMTSGDTLYKLYKTEGCFCLCCIKDSLA